jgi:hypothetical protein
LITDQSGSDSNTPIELDPPFTIKGAIQRALLTEALEPSSPDFNPAEDLKVMRTMKRVLENRLQHPELYNAPGAKDERDILMAHGQFPEFLDYPKKFRLMSKLPWMMQIKKIRSGLLTGNMSSTPFRCQTKR